MKTNINFCGTPNVALKKAAERPKPPADSQVIELEKVSQNGDHFTSLAAATSEPQFQYDEIRERVIKPTDDMIQELVDLNQSDADLNRDEDKVFVLGHKFNDIRFDGALLVDENGPKHFQADEYDNSSSPDAQRAMSRDEAGATYIHRGFTEFETVSLQDGNLVQFWEPAEALDDSIAPPELDDKVSLELLSQKHFETLDEAIIARAAKNLFERAVENVKERVEAEFSALQKLDQQQEDLSRKKGQVIVVDHKLGTFYGNRDAELKYSDNGFSSLTSRSFSDITSLNRRDRENEGGQVFKARKTRNQEYWEIGNVESGLGKSRDLAVFKGEKFKINHKAGYFSYTDTKRNLKTFRDH